MHLRGARIGKADVDAARHQGPHQTLRTVHHSAPVRESFQTAEDQSFPARFVKGPRHIAAIAKMIAGAFFNAEFEKSAFGTTFAMALACEIAAI
jgi:hypothetical protein